MNENLKQGIYAKSGGYDLFCKDLEDIVKKYNSQTNKEVKVLSILHNLILILKQWKSMRCSDIACVCQQAEAVLEVFLKQKSVDSKAILQADKKLTEKEKKIKGRSSPFSHSDQVTCERSAQRFRW